MITREEAVSLLASVGTEPNLLKHAYASEAVLRALAVRLGADAEEWAMTGLLHDLDYPLTVDTMNQHGDKGAEMLRGKLPEEALHAIRAHNAEMTGVKPDTPFDYALRCGETVTGLIMAAALVRPTGIEGMEAKSVKKKMKDKAFAASVNRDTIKECAELGLELTDFLSLAIDAMDRIAIDLGLHKN